MCEALHRPNKNLLITMPIYFFDWTVLKEYIFKNMHFLTFKECSVDVQNYFFNINYLPFSNVHCILN